MMQYIYVCSGTDFQIPDLVLVNAALHLLQQINGQCARAPVPLESEALKISASNFTRQCSNTVYVRWKFLSKIHRVSLGICWLQNFENWCTHAKIKWVVYLFIYWNMVYILKCLL